MAIQGCRPLSSAVAGLTSPKPRGGTVRTKFIDCDFTFYMYVRQVKLRLLDPSAKTNRTCLGSIEMVTGSKACHIRGSQHGRSLHLGPTSARCPFNTEASTRGRTFDLLLLRGTTHFPPKAPKFGFGDSTTSPGFFRTPEIPPGPSWESRDHVGGTCEPTGFSEHGSIGMAYSYTRGSPSAHRQVHISQNMTFLESNSCPVFLFKAFWGSVL